LEVNNLEQFFAHFWFNFNNLYNFMITLIRFTFGFFVKDLLKEMLSNLNIIKSTNKPKLLDRLEELERQLNICEKALTDYLETKRLAYPRFYFISSVDLLDILSNGKAPFLLSLSFAIKNSFYRRRYILSQQETILKWYASICPNCMTRWQSSSGKLKEIQ